MASALRWPSFTSELEADAGSAIGYRTCGTLVVDADDDDRAFSEDLYRFQCSLGLDVERLNARRVRQLEPNIAPGVRSGLLAKGDHQVQTRRLVTALLAAATGRGVHWQRTPALSIETAGGTVEGVRCDDAVLRAPVVVVAAGCWSGSIPGLPPGVVPPVRPVKGQILRLAGEARRTLLQRSVRGLVQGTSVYLVPRADGTVVIGATVEERGFDTTVTAGAVYELLRDARRVVPGITEFELVEARAGLRPGSPDNAPIVGPLVRRRPSAGHRSPPQRHPPGPAHRRRRGRPGRRRGPTGRDGRLHPGPLRSLADRRSGAPVNPFSIEVNGRSCVVPPGTTVATVVAQWCDSPDGIAVARNGEVVPRSAWPSTDVTRDDHVEIVTAAAGG